MENERKTGPWVYKGLFADVDKLKEDKILALSGV